MPNVMRATRSNFRADRAELAGHHAAGADEMRSASAWATTMGGVRGAWRRGPRGLRRREPAVSMIGELIRHSIRMSTVESANSRAQPKGARLRMPSGASEPEPCPSFRAGTPNQHQAAHTRFERFVRSLGQRVQRVLDQARHDLMGCGRSRPPDDMEDSGGGHGDICGHRPQRRRGSAVAAP